jgi:hypothetical protein
MSKYPLSLGVVVAVGMVAGVLLLATPGANLNAMQIGTLVAGCVFLLALLAFAYRSKDATAPAQAIAIESQLSDLARNFDGLLNILNEELNKQSGRKPATEVAAG